MSTEDTKPTWSLPYTSPLPEGAGARGHIKRLRVVAYIVAAVLLIIPAVQFQYGTMTRQRKADARAAASAPSREADVTKTTKGAIGRWRIAVREFWAGGEIYEPKAPGRRTWLHPNMPFTVILLTPFAYLPLWAATATFNILKLLAIAAALLMITGAANHNGRRMPDWVVALGLLWAIKPIVGDIQHGNTNVFVLAAIAGHLWLYRRGRDIAAGASLALAICLKMTPALFVLYWIYQRGWKVLAGAAAALVVYVAVVPAVVVGPGRAVEVTRTWLDNLIVPGLVKGAWYPIHINQSVSGVLGRYMLAEPQPGGDIYWNPDDNYYEELTEHDWIAFVSLSPAAARWVVRAAQAIIVIIGAWAIGWRRLPRDDGRRALHYGLVAVGMLLLNQRTWDHHATVLLILTVPLWHAIAYGRCGRAARVSAFAATMLAAACLWLSSNGVFKLAAKLAGQGGKTGGTWADKALAYGPVFYCFVLLFAAGVIAAVSLRRADRPYAECRQRLGEGRT